MGEGELRGARRRDRGEAVSTPAAEAPHPGAPGAFLHPGAPGEMPHKLLRVYQEARDALRALDLRARCEAAGYRFDPACISVDFLGRRFLLDTSSGELEPEGVLSETSVGKADADRFAPALLAHFTDRILILHYLARTTGAYLSGRVVGFDQLAGGRFYGSAFRKRTEQPLADLFGQDPGRLAAAAGKIGGVPGQAGSASVLLWPFPKVPMTLVVWPGEDEIPANGRVIFDDTAEEHLSTEDIAVLGDQVVRRLKELSAE